MDTPPGFPGTPDTVAPLTERSSDAFAHLAPLVDHELRRLEQRYLQRERTGNADQPTALANGISANRSAKHGAVTGRSVGDRLIDQKHFFAICARQMRQILVDHATSRGREKRQGLGPDDNVDLDDFPVTGGRFDILELDLLLKKLERVDPTASLAFELYYFGGHHYKELAIITKVSEVTVQRQLRFSRAWLLSQVPRSAS